MATLDFQPQVGSTSEFFRFEATRKLNPVDQARLGQYMTPASIGGFMAGMFQNLEGRLRILDPGAGVGSLTAAVADQHPTTGLPTARALHGRLRDRFSFDRLFANHDGRIDSELRFQREYQRREKCALTISFKFVANCSVQTCLLMLTPTTTRFFARHHEPTLRENRIRFRNKHRSSACGHRSTKFSMPRSCYLRQNYFATAARWSQSCRGRSVMELTFGHSEGNSSL